MKKELEKTYRVYQNIDGKLEQVTLQLEGHGFKTMFQSEEEALEGLKANIDNRYKNGSFTVLPVYYIKYTN